VIFYDTEGCGFHGPTVLIQYAIDDGPIELYNVWENPIRETLDLIEWMMEQTNVGFNLAFDQFHLQRLYNLFDYYVRYGGGSINHIPMNYIDEIAVCDSPARVGQCLKPAGALDLMLVARKGKYQSLMERSDIRLRRVPKAMAWHLAEELEKRVQLDEIYFARRKDKHAPKWKVYDLEDDPEFKDVCLKFRASGALKALAVYALGHNPDDVFEFSDVSLPNGAYPKEVGWAPFAGALGGKPGNWKEEWPEKITHHISHWYWNRLARKYAEDDIKYTRDLYYHLDKPEPNDDDSVLACMVGSVRWRGFKLDLDKIRELRSIAIVKAAKAPTAPGAVKAYIQPLLSEEEILITEGSTRKVILKQISEWDDHPASKRAKEVIKAREAAWQVNMFDKLLQAGRFHASFNVIGTLSSRMSGRDGLNAQGIKKEDKIRGCFTLADGDLELDGGDFDSFEVSLAEAVYNDPNLRRDLQSGLKIHGLFAMKLWPGMTYEEVLATESTDDDRYTKGKQGVFAMIYGGDSGTLQTKLGVPLEQAEEAYQEFAVDYPGIAKAREKTFDNFCSMRQTGGIGTKVVWHDPADYVESFLGFKRFFTLENMVCRALFDLAQRPPRSWRAIKIKVQRREGRIQTASGATQSALYACAFGIQASNMRAAANHEIQSPGAKITKRLQCAIWGLQPVGIGSWVVQPLNAHDEVMCPRAKRVKDRLKVVVDDIVESYRPKVPLIGMKWKQGLESWADK
jgi:hypothetical protein